MVELFLIIIIIFLISLQVSETVIRINEYHSIRL